MVKVGDSLVDEIGKLADQGGFTYTKFVIERTQKYHYLVEA
jgi:hypothetical protein